MEQNVKGHCVHCPCTFLSNWPVIYTGELMRRTVLNSQPACVSCAILTHLGWLECKDTVAVKPQTNGPSRALDHHALIFLRLG